MGHVRGRTGAGGRAAASRSGRAALAAPLGGDHDGVVSEHVVLYDDGRVACDEAGLTIRWYYPWGAKRVPYGRIRSTTAFELSPVRGQWRLWGSGDLTHWYNLDPGRPRKERGIELDLGGRVRPRITPDDVDAVQRILEDHRGA